VPLAASSSTAERLCYTLARPPVLGMTRSRISVSRRHSSVTHQTPAASLRHLTTVCSWLSSALTQPSLFLSDDKTSLNCLVSTVCSRTDNLVIVSLKARTSLVIQPHLASGCHGSVLRYNTSSKRKISHHIIFNSLSKMLHILRRMLRVIRSTCQQC